MSPSSTYKYVYMLENLDILDCKEWKIQGKKIKGIKHMPPQGSIYYRITYQLIHAKLT